jgi:peptidoglycan/LPS O-acetylase OafA/YrhL
MAVAAAPEIVATSRPKVHFPNLDGLRFVAFFLVYLQHGFRAGELGDDGVSFFFVLSGFLITYLILAEVGHTGQVDVKAFYVRRTLRIWPLYYVVLVFAFLAYPIIKAALGLSSYIEAGNPLYYIFFAGNFDVIHLGHGRGAMSTNITWSVAIEEQFYLTWPLLFLTIPRRFYKFIFPAIIIGSGLFRFLHRDDGMVLYFHTFSVISDMAVGGLAAYLAINSKRFTEAISNLRRPAIIISYGAGLALMMLKPDRLILSLFFAFVVLEQNYAERSVFKMGRFRLVSKLGVYTYGLYLLHPIALLLIDSTAKYFKAEIHQLIYGAAGLALSITLSIASYHLLEKRFLLLKARFARVIS